MALIRDILRQNTVQLIVLCRDLLGYERQILLWGDFSIAELFGEEAIKDIYKRAKAEWSINRIYGTELSMVLNYRCWYRY